MDFWDEDQVEAAPDAEFWKADKAVEGDWWKKDKAAESPASAEGATVAQMASATRHTVGVVGRAVNALDVAMVDAVAPNRVEGVDEYGRPLDPRGRNPAQLNPSLTESRTPESSLLEPLLRLPRVTAQEVSDALSYLASASPDLTEEESEAVIEHTMKPGNLEKIVAGAQRAAVGVPESFTSPLGIATLGTSVLPATAGRIVAGGFFGDIVRHIPEQIKQLREAVASGDSERITETSGNLLASGTMAALTGRHAATKPNPAKTLAEQLEKNVEATKGIEASPAIVDLAQRAPLTARSVSQVDAAARGRNALEPTPELKPGDPFNAEDIPLSPTPLTTAAVESVKAKEPALDTPAPTPAVATSESGSPPVPAGVPPAKPSVSPEVTVAKPEGERALTSENPFDTSVTSARLTELDKSKPRPTAKLYGQSGGTPELRAENDAKLRQWTNQRAKAVREHRAMVEKSNEWIRQQKTDPPLITPEEMANVVRQGPPSETVARMEAEEAAYKVRREISDLNQQLSKEQKALDKNVAKMGSMVPPPIVAEVTRKIGTRMAKIQDKIDALEKQLPQETQGAIGTPGPTLAPAAAPTPVLPPKSQRRIITDIAQGLKLPIRFGRLRTNRFAGYFLKLQNLIGSKRANDIPIVSHEAGHKLDATFNFSTDPALRAELERLGDPASVQGSRSSWTKSKSLSYKRGEGVAEFVRHWLTDPPAAAQHAPNMKAAFEAALDSNKDFGDTMRQAQSDIQTWRNAEPQARLRSHISVGGNPNKTPYTFDQLTRDLVDDLHFLRMAVNDAKAGGTSLPPSENPYTLARNLRGSYGMADSFIRSGVADFKTKEVTLGTSLQDALKPVAGRIADFRDWIIAKRAQELHGQGRETGLVDSDVQFTASKFDKDAAFQDAFTKLKKWNDDLLQYAVDSGFVTKEGAAAMREMNQDYVPLHRVFEVGAGEAPAIEGAGTGRGLNVGKPGSLKRLTGSARDIVDPLETMVRNAYALITASEKFAINRAVADMSKLPDMGKWVEHIATPKERVQVGVEKLREQLEANGADLTKVPDDLLLQFFQNSKSAPFGENVIKTVRDGKPEFYRLKRELFETFNALDLEDSGTLVRMLSAPSQVLRAGVVLDPSFALANAMRDAFTSSIVSRHGLLPFEATFRGVAAMLKNPKLVAEWEAAGGKNAIEANYFDRQKLQKFLAEKITKDLTPAERALITLKSPLQALRWLTSLSEEATRIGEYKKVFDDLRKGGMSEGEARRQAAFESRDRQDFAKGGAKTKIPRRLAAFWNAGIQANVRLAQAFKERPMQTTMKGLAFITIPKLIEQSLNWNDDDYWDRPQWERDLFFLIPAGKGDDGHTRFIRIPTPFEAGVIFGTFPGRILQSIRESSAENLKNFPMVLAKQTIPNPTPQFALTIFEDFMVGKKGYDTYRGRQIVPESIAQLPADMQWTEQTSLTARKLGAALGFPPVKIDHIINQTTGGLGKQLTHQVVDRAISVATGEERTAKSVVPGGRFVTTPAAVSSQAIEDFYTTLDKVKTAAAGEKKGRDDELARWKPMFTSAESRMSQLRRSMRQTKDEAQKNAIAENILKLARDTMNNFREQTK